MSLSVYIPVPGESVELSKIAARPRTLDGAVVGLVNNNKANGPALLSAIGRLLQANFALKGIVGPIRTDNVYFPSEGQYKELAEQCDVIILGLGDCGSCSACSVHVATDFELLGVPAVAVCTKPFLASGNAMATRQGFDGFRFVRVEHPLSSLSADDLEVRAREALPQVLSILGIVKDISVEQVLERHEPVAAREAV
jgi:hypothetical protein